MATRRDFLEIAGATAAGAILTAAVADADSKTPPRPGAPIAAGDHKILDLPFQPGKLRDTPGFQSLARGDQALGALRA